MQKSLQQLNSSCSRTVLSHFDEKTFYNCFPHVYFKIDETDESFYATGAVFVFDHYPDLTNFKNLHLFFAGNPLAEPETQGSLVAFIPQKIVHCSKDKIELIEYAFESTISLNVSQDRRSQRSTPMESYTSGVIQIQKLIAQGLLKKGVLAQQSEHPIPQTFELKTLQNHPSTGIRFYYQFDESLTFFGITPEWLYRRKDQTIQVDALAGTTSTINPEALDSVKIIKEFHWVKEGIRQSLDPFMIQGSFSAEDSVKKHHHLLHRYNCYQGELKPGLCDAKLIQTLHPTAALIGLPKYEALNSIPPLETFDRGFYGSPVGFYSDKRAEVAVAIRSCLIQDKKAFLYSGAGIVEDSEPEQEWEEVQKKLLLTQSLLAIQP